MGGIVFIRTARASRVSDDAGVPVRRLCKADAPLIILISQPRRLIFSLLHLGVLCIDIVKSTRQSPSCAVATSECHLRFPVSFHRSRQSPFICQSAVAKKVSTLYSTWETFTKFFRSNVRFIFHCWKKFAGLPSFCVKSGVFIQRVNPLLFLSASKVVPWSPLSCRDIIRRLKGLSRLPVLLMSSLSGGNSKSRGGIVSEARS